MTQRATGRPVCRHLPYHRRSFSVSIVASPVWLVSNRRTTGTSIIAFMSVPPDPSSTGEYRRSSPTVLCPESQGAPEKSEERQRYGFHHLCALLVNLILRRPSGRRRPWIGERPANRRYEQRTYSNEQRGHRSSPFQPLRGRMRITSDEGKPNALKRFRPSAHAGGGVNRFSDPSGSKDSGSRIPNTMVRPADYRRVPGGQTGRRPCCCRCVRGD
jgi:hypothetical protein